MKKIRIVFSSLLLVLIISCSGNDTANSELNEIVSLESTISAKKFIDTNEYIDVTLSKSKFSMESMSDTDIAKLKAAVYRFYKTVKVENDKYTPPSMTAKQINISEHLYESLYENLLEMNEKLEEFTKNNEEFEVPEITNQYLESLLK